MPELALDGGTPVRATPLAYDRGVLAIGDEERAAVLEVLESRSLFRYYGPDFQHRVERFEAGVRERLGVAHAVAVSSGTAALRAALAALGIGPGDEVIVPAFTFIATVNAVVVSGAVPVFCEVDDSLTVDPDDLAARITPRTAAVIPVHLENAACDMDRIIEVASGADIAVLEDAAQALGASYHGTPVGRLGDIAAFSLQLSKNITSGEGGVVTTDDERLHERASRYQDQGGQFVTQYGVTRGGGDPFVGENLRMTEVAGAIAEVQLGRLDDLCQSMSASAAYITQGIGEIDGLTPRRLPDPSGAVGSSLTWFLPDTGLARHTAAALRAEGMPAAQIYNGRPVYENPAILDKRTASMKGPPWHSDEFPCDIEYRSGMCPQTEDLGGRSVTIGIGPGYDKTDCDDVVAAVTKVATALLE